MIGAKFKTKILVGFQKFIRASSILLDLLFSPPVKPSAVFCQKPVESVGAAKGSGGKWERKLRMRHLLVDVDFAMFSLHNTLRYIHIYILYIYVYMRYICSDTVHIYIHYAVLLENANWCLQLAFLLGHGQTLAISELTWAHKRT